MAKGLLESSLELLILFILGEGHDIENSSKVPFSTKWQPSTQSLIDYPTYSGSTDIQEVSRAEA